MQGLQGATPGALAGGSQTHELVDVALDQDSCWLVALGSCPALQTDPSSYTELFYISADPHQELSWIPAPEQPPPSPCVRAGCPGWQQAEMPISAGPAVCQLPGQALAFLSPRAQLGSAVALGCGTGAPFRAAGAFAKHHFSKQGLSCPLFLASINPANISKLAECSGDEAPPDSYFGGITVLQQDFFYKRGFFLCEGDVFLEC